MNLYFTDEEKKHGRVYEVGGMVYFLWPEIQAAYDHEGSLYLGNYAGIPLGELD